MIPLQAGFLEWLGENPWALWVLAGLLCTAGELATLNLVLLMIAAGAFSGALVSYVAPDLVWAQALTALVVAAMTLAVLRPVLLKQIHPATGYRSALSKLVGSEGVATAEITRSGGQARVNGELWSARTLDGATRIAPGSGVEVYEVDGVTLVVHPGMAGELDAGPGER